MKYYISTIAFLFLLTLKPVHSNAASGSKDAETCRSVPLIEIFKSTEEKRPNPHEVIPACLRANETEPANGEIQTRLAVLYAKIEEYEEARRWARRSAENGQYFGAALMVALLKEGKGGAPDPEGAEKWQARAEELLRLQIQTAEAASCSKLASLKDVPSYKEISGKAALPVCLDELAERPDDIELWAQLSRAYMADGQFDAAMGWARKAAEKGSPLGQFILGEMHYHGSGVARDSQAALEFYKRAGSRGVAHAKFKLGLMHLRGDGTQQNIERANMMFIQAAQAGDPGAQFEIANSYFRGRGMRRNPASALKWYEKASSEIPRAKGLAGWIYWSGSGVKVATAAGAARFRSAADQGDAFSQYATGSLYEYGHVVQKDLQKALAYYRMAEENGIQSGQRPRKRIEAKLGLPSKDKLNASRKATKNELEDIYNFISLQADRADDAVAKLKRKLSRLGPSSDDVEQWVNRYAAWRGMTIHDFDLDECVALKDSDEHYCRFRATYKGSNSMSNFLAGAANLQGYMWASFRERSGVWRHVKSFQNCQVLRQANVIRCTPLK
ncbi:hypothetical protein [Hoeflea sp.]|uniref:tetratricopeptide repeat protein n=1 Tax=Hoeflea sp. TaxID=1940281 RepID=UPI003B522133